MKKSLLLFLLVILNWQGTVVTKTDVYLCNSSGGKKYHYSKTAEDCLIAKRKSSR